MIGMPHTALASIVARHHGCDMSLRLARVAPKSVLDFQLLYSLQCDFECTELPDMTW